jgi:hypothetical protein
MYLAGCAHAFEQDWINVYQLLAARGVSGGQSRRSRSRARQKVGRGRDAQFIGVLSNQNRKCQGRGNKVQE